MSDGELWQITSTTHVVDVADGGSKPPQPMALKQPPHGGASPAGTLSQINQASVRGGENVKKRG